MSPYWYLHLPCCLLLGILAARASSWIELRFYLRSGTATAIGLLAALLGSALLGKVLL